MASSPPPAATPAPTDPSPVAGAAPDAAANPVAANPDARITRDVRSSIAGVLPGGDVNIGVATHDGIVVLTGNLPSQQAIDQVTAVAGLVQDVRKVDASSLLLAGQ
jgi:hyperosmotically inducible protein